MFISDMLFLSANMVKVFQTGHQIIPVTGIPNQLGLTEILSVCKISI